MTAPRLSPSKHHVHARLGPYSKAGAIALLDGRSREAQFMKRVRADLVAHVGGNPSAVQRQLIERAVRLSLRLEQMDERLTHGEEFRARDHNHYLAWSNALTRTLARLGLRGPTAKPPTIVEIAEQIAAAKRDGVAA